VSSDGYDFTQARPKEFIEGLAKGIAILESFGPGRSEMTLSEVARHVGVSPPAARRALLTLQTLGYVGQRGRHFFLRPKVVALASSFYFSARIDQVLLPELQRIVGMYGDAASIATLDRRDVIYLAHHSEQRARRAAAVVGARYPAHATSMGRVLLAGLDPDAFEAWLERGPLAALTTRTVTEKDAFRGIIGEVRARGYATAVDQLDYGITALAVPVRGPSGETVAALNSSGYTGLVTVDRLVAERLAELRLTASRLELSIGRDPVMSAMLGAG
jgi:IclR family transcriptional regulator, pca regulon regulatory protein